ncbi:MAG: C-N hydrolase family amidase [Methanomassiliicoccales archaeon PtaU1.Bin124]|nr:MAG: C-N hydrolase family amidase [Methanomassiliicoccales archaeon PtaU1.Bin124]
MKIALAQVRCALGNREKNLDRMHQVVSSTEADLFVFCELYLTGYMVRDRVFNLAERIEDGSVEEVEKVAEEHGCGILFGMARKDDELPGVLRNSAVMVSPDEGVQVYDKLYPATFGPFEEGLYFGKGTEPKMFQLGKTRFGVDICYDLFHGEIARTYALAGAEALLTISASPYTSREFFERLVPARAIDNTIYSIYVNQVGAQLNMVFFGGSEAYGPRGDRLCKCKYFDEDVQVIETDSHALHLARRNRPTVRDGSDALLEQ